MRGDRQYNRVTGGGGLAVSRRDFHRLAALGALGGSLSGWLEALADTATTRTSRHRCCILLWMAGGPSQIDTFDLKPDHANGGQFRPIATATPGMQISEHLPKLASLSEHLAIVRSMTSKEGDHGRATYYVRNGYLPQGPIRYPTLGSLVAKELGDPAAEIPSFVSIAPQRAFSPGAYGPGFLGSQYAPLLVGDGAAGNSADALRVEDLAPPASVAAATGERRLAALTALNERFLSGRGGPPASGYRSAYERAARLMHSRAGGAFELDQEPAALRDAYGRNRFGQGCLLARRLVERGVPFVEVTLAGVDQQQAIGWDTHTENFPGVRRLCELLDPAWATLLEDLQSRSLLETTLVVWMGEFGRTPAINGNAGRDHFPQAWSAVLAGGGVTGGAVVGRTSADGLNVEDRPTKVPNLLSTIYQALAIDPTTQNPSNAGRPIRIVDPSASPIAEILS